jgi:hypothetical protein
MGVGILGRGAWMNGLGMPGGLTSVGGSIPGCGVFGGTGGSITAKRRGVGRFSSVLFEFVLHDLCINDT